MVFQMSTPFKFLTLDSVNVRLFSSQITMKLITGTSLLFQIFYYIPITNGKGVLYHGLNKFSRELRATSTHAESQSINLKSRSKDAPSMIQLYEIDMRANWNSEFFQKLDAPNDKLSICNTNKSTEFKWTIIKAIDKTLNFYKSHIEEVFSGETSPVVGLALLKDVDNKYGKQFQSTYPISDWIVRFCDTPSYSGDKEFCTNFAKNWRQRSDQAWKNSDVVESNYGKWETVGQEKELLRGKLNGLCQAAIVNACEVLLVCERTLYDPVPGSMYFLTHQMLQRILTEQSDCSSKKYLLDDDINDQLCSKMYQEARLVAQMGYPQIHRDLFGEYVAICGFMGYPNFFRKDWIEALLSWQSKSKYGCFSNEKEYKSAFISAEIPILRKSTGEELEKELVSDEKCLPHFTSVALAALATSWDYIEENCP